MNSWVLGGPRSTRWHQAEYDRRTGAATLRCSGQVRVLGDGEGAMDYRWRPSFDSEWCLHPACRQEVAP